MTAFVADLDASQGELPNQMVVSPEVGDDSEERREESGERRLGRSLVGGGVSTCSAPTCYYLVK